VLELNTACQQQLNSMYNQSAALLVLHDGLGLPNNIKLHVLSLP
jgi:hypothetical protein